MHVKSSRRVTLKAIAEDLGVAPSTVSNAYNRPNQLSPELRIKILERAKELGYAGPDPVAASLRRGKTGAVGLIFPNSLSYTFTDPIAASFVRGVAGEVERAGYGLLLVGGFSVEDGAEENGAGETGREVSGARRETFLAAEANVDGFVLYNLSSRDPLLDTALGRNLPTILVDNPDVAGVPSVIVEDELGAYRAAEHLLSLGHKRLGVISLELDLSPKGALIGPARQREAAYRPTQTRLRGYAAAVSAAGLTWDEVLVYETEDNSVKQGRKAAAALLSQPRAPTAFLAMSDQLALGALALATERGVRVPVDLSIVGYDDSVLAAQATPPLTTVRQPYVEKGRIAGEMLLARLRGETPTSRSLKTELVVRGSSGWVQR